MFHIFTKHKQLPKNLLFTGESKLKWHSFLFPHESTANNRGWEEKENINYFFDFLSEKALDSAGK